MYNNGESIDFWWANKSWWARKCILIFLILKKNRLPRNRSVITSAKSGTHGWAFSETVLEDIWQLWKFPPSSADNYRIQLLPCDTSNLPINKKDIKQSAHNIISHSVRNNSHCEREVSCDNIWRIKDGLVFSLSSALPNNLFGESYSVHWIWWYLLRHKIHQNPIPEKWHFCDICIPLNSQKQTTYTNLVSAVEQEAWDMQT